MDSQLPDLIAAARLAGAALDTAPPVASLAKGYAAASALPARMGLVVGWKVGATSVGAQALLKVDAPIYGRVFAGSLWPNGAAISIAGERAAEAEPEILIALGEDPDPSSRETLRGAIASVRIGLEVNRPSRDDALTLGAPFIVADNAANVALVLGPEIPLDALDDPAAITVRLEGEGGSSEGSAAAVLGDPLEALRWLVLERAGTERPVRAGDVVATGAMARALPLPLGGAVAADFGRHGRVSVGRPAPDEAARTEVMSVVGD